MEELRIYSSSPDYPAACCGQLHSKMTRFPSGFPFGAERCLPKRSCMPCSSCEQTHSPRIFNWFSWAHTIDSMDQISFLMTWIFKRFARWIGPNTLDISYPYKRVLVQGFTSGTFLRPSGDLTCGFPLLFGSLYELPYCRRHFSISWQGQGNSYRIFRWDTQRFSGSHHTDQQWGDSYLH